MSAAADHGCTDCCKALPEMAGLFTSDYNTTRKLRRSGGARLDNLILARNFSAELLISVMAATTPSMPSHQLSSERIQAIANG